MERLTRTSGTDRKRVLVVGMFDSPHFASWLENFQDQPVDFTLVPSSPHRKINRRLLDLRGNQNSVAGFDWDRLRSSLSLFLVAIDRTLGTSLQARLLAKKIRALQPHFVHAIEVQGAGYMCLGALELLGEKKFDLILTNYGSDIYWFSRDSRHVSRITNLLQKVDRYFCECQRDVALAKKLGYSGRVMPVQPNSARFDPNTLPKLVADESRGSIAIKGYHGWAGRARNVVRAISLAPERFHGYELEFFSCNLSTLISAKIMGLRSGIKVKVYPKRKLSSQQMMSLFQRAKIYVGVSATDGISTSMLEAMAMGAIPVQSNTSCCGEWFQTTGIQLANDSPYEILRGIERAFSLARDPENAIRNRATIVARCSTATIQEGALTAYQTDIACQS